MTAITVRSEDWDILARLADLDLTRELLIAIVKASVAAQGGCTDNDPPNARGFEAWRMGVRHSREVLRPEGWEKDDTGGFSTVVNHKRKIRLAIMNSDDGAGISDRVAQNRSRKGPNSERAAVANQQLLIPGSENWPISLHADNARNIEGYTTWHLCIYISGDAVRAELSILSDFEDGYFKGCIEKLLILGPGEWDGLDFKGDSDDDSGPEFDIEIKRK